MSLPLLILIGADKGGVGKTMIARALLSYFTARSVSVRVFDTEPAPGVLKRFQADAELVDIADVAGQMKIFDALAASSVTLVDIKAGELSNTLRALQQIGLLADVRDRKVKLVVLHVLGNTVASLSEIGTTAGLLLDGGTHILVKNLATGNARFFEWDQAAHDRYFKAIDAEAILTMPNLNTMACEVVENDGVPFATFAKDDKSAKGERSRVLRGYVSHWLKSAHAEFDRAGLDQLATRD